MVRLVKVLPFLVLVVNGDVFHAGPPCLDANTAITCTADIIRFQVHLVKERYGLPDGVHYLPDFKPKILRPPSTSQDDLDSVADAVCGESPDVEKASTKAPAAAKRSHEPKLGSPAALPQQADRIIRTRQANRSSRKK